MYTFTFTTLRVMGIAMGRVWLQKGVYGTVEVKTIKSFFKGIMYYFWSNT